MNPTDRAKTDTTNPIRAPQYPSGTKVVRDSVSTIDARIVVAHCIKAMIILLVLINN
jgi:hypothetical protein